MSTIACSTYLQQKMKVKVSELIKGNEKIERDITTGESCMLDYRYYAIEGMVKNWQ